MGTAAETRVPNKVGGVSIAFGPQNQDQDQDQDEDEDQQSAQRMTAME